MSRRGAFLKSDLFLWLNLQPAEFRLRGIDRAILAGVDRDLTRRPRERLLDDVNAGSLIVVVDLELLQSLDGAQQRDAAAQGRVASGRTLSARRLHRDELEPPGRARCCLLQQARDMRAMDQGGQGRDQVDAAVRARTFAANAVRVQLHALACNLGNFLRMLATPNQSRTGR